METSLKVRLYGEPCLRMDSVDVIEVGQPERILISCMLDTMYKEEGIGLAAPQVGVNQNIIVCDIGDGHVIMVNPEVLRKDGSGVMDEGCLSLPGVNVSVCRPLKIRVRYMDENNEVFEREFSSLMARVILHEMDHLKGRLICDYVDQEHKAQIEQVLARIEQGILPSKEKQHHARKVI